MWISEGQKDKLKNAFESNCKSITVRLTFSDLHDEDVIDWTKSMSKTQLAHNMKIEGGFSAASAGLIPFLTRTVLPALEVYWD